HVRIGHDAIALDHKAGADAAPKHARIPWSAIIRSNFGGGNTHQTFLDWTVWPRRRHRNWNGDHILCRRPRFCPGRPRLVLSWRRRWFSRVLLAERCRSSEHQNGNENRNTL